MEMSIYLEYKLASGWKHVHTNRWGVYVNMLQESVRSDFIDEVVHGNAFSSDRLQIHHAKEHPYAVAVTNGIRVRVRKENPRFHYSGVLLLEVDVTLDTDLPPKAARREALRIVKHEMPDVVVMGSMSFDLVAVYGQFDGEDYHPRLVEVVEAQKAWVKEHCK